MLKRQEQLRTQIHQLRDAALFALALFLAHALRVWLGELVRTWDLNPAFNPLEDQVQLFTEFAWLYLIIIPGAPLILESMGFYQRALLSSRRTTLWILLKGCVVVTMGVILVIFLFNMHLARLVIIFFGGISFALLWLSDELWRFAYRSGFGQLQYRKRVIIVGSEEDTARMREELSVQAQGGLEVVGEVDLNDAPVEDLVRMLHKCSANGVMLNAKHTYFGQVEKAIQACEREGVEAWLVADFFQTQVSRTSFDDFYGRPVLVFRSVPEVSWQGVLKHVIDVLGAVFLLVVSSPMFLVAAIAIKLSSPGTIFFRQRRCGLNGRPFTMLKFRSMVSDADQRKEELAFLNEMAGPVFKVTNDPRVTWIGRFLRKYSIDEFPQLINVLRGEMSLVGPRPLPVDEVERFDDPAHRRRLSVKPGLTCLWQVSGRNNVRDFREWVRLDLEYIDNWSLWLDVKILWRTIPVVLVGQGAK